MALTITHPLFVGWLVTYFLPGSQVTTTAAYLYATGLLLITLSITLSEQWYYFMSDRLGIRTTVLFSSAIFQKV